MATLEKSILLKLLALLVRPAVKFCLRHSLRIQDLIECVKVELISAAKAELREKEIKPNVSKLSVMTGVHRRDVTRIKDGGIILDSDRDYITKIIGQWRNDKRFTNKSGEPRVLSCGDENSDFSKLCSLITSDLNPGTVLFELKRIGAVSESKGGLTLIHQSYVPKGDPVLGFSILSEDYITLLDTVEENVLKEPNLAQLHARTEYDNVRPEAVLDIMRWLLKEGHEFHARVREYVSQFDQDINPDPNFQGRGIKVVFSAFSNVFRKKGDK